MDRLDAMATLLAAVDTGSLSAASRSLRMPLATVSRKISELESHLHTQLLLRTSRRLSLTEAGQSYVEACRRILEHINDAERSAAGEYRMPQGNLTIAAPIVFGRLHVAPVVLDFLNAYPDITIRLMLADSVVNITDEHVDVAVRIGNLPDSSLMAIRLGQIGRVTCAAPTYLASRGIPRHPDELRAHDCITFEGRYSSNTWMFAHGKRALPVVIRARLTVNTAEAALDAARAGGGITRVLSYQATENLRAGSLERALREFEPEPMPVSLVYADQALLPLKLRAFLDFAAPRLKASVAEHGGL